MTGRRWMGWVLAASVAASLPAAASAEPLWQTLPPTPSLPAADVSGLAPVDGVNIWYAAFGAGSPVILLHGGLANSNYWGLEVPALAAHHRVIVMDSRGHGRSSRDARPFGYDLMADDVVGLMDFLKLDKAAIVGWSDGAILGLDLAIRHPTRVTGVFVFAANADPSGVKDVGAPATFRAFARRGEAEYDALSPTPGKYKDFVKQISHMWATQPHFTAAQLAAIEAPVWIVDGDHDEAIKRAHTLWMADQMPRAGLLIQPEVSHFSMLQDPVQFTSDVLHFLDRIGAP